MIGHSIHSTDNQSLLMIGHLPHSTDNQSLLMTSQSLYSTNNHLLLTTVAMHRPKATEYKSMASLPGRFIAFQAFNVLKETNSGYVLKIP